jgi:hypothetical protein
MACLSLAKRMCMFSKDLFDENRRNTSGPIVWEKCQNKIRYFIVHLHRVLDPESQTPQR